jgi:hypothetical protein
VKKWGRALTIAIAAAILFVFPAAGAVAVIVYLGWELRDLAGEARKVQHPSKEL